LIVVVSVDGVMEGADEIAVYEEKRRVSLLEIIGLDDSMERGMLMYRGV